MKKKLMLIIAIVILLSFCIGFFKFRSQINCYTVSLSNFIEISKDIYMQPDISAEDKKTILSNISEAKNNVMQVFGSFNSKPTIIVCDDADLGKRFGMEHRTGITCKTIAGTYIVIGPDGQNIDVIAHELTHCELAYRVGWIKSLKIPTWFDDGLATQVDNRPQYSESEWTNITENGKKVLEMSKLDSPKQFYVSDLNTRIIHYTLAKHELHRWLSIVGQKGLLQLIDDMNKGKDLYKMYNEIELECSKK